MTNNKKEIYIITFDLLTDKETENKLFLQEHKSLSSMYSDIKKHMLDNKFMWQQGSTYISKEKLYLYELNEIIDELFNKHKYLTEYVRDMTNGIIKDINLINFNSVIKKYNKKYKKQIIARNELKNAEYQMLLEQERNKSSLKP